LIIWATARFQARVYQRFREADTCCMVESKSLYGHRCRGAHESNDVCLRRNACNKTPVCAETSKRTLFYRVTACSGFYWKQFILDYSFCSNTYILKQNCYEEWCS